MKKLRHILPWAALVMLASTVAISMAALRLASHNKALEAVDVSFIARKKLKSRVVCTFNFDKNKIAELIARKKAELNQGEP
jgi:hypothetical protein